MLYTLRVKGRTLLQHLTHKPGVTDADVAELLRQMFNALAYLHTRTVCHLDCRVCSHHNILSVTDCRCFFAARQRYCTSTSPCGDHKTDRLWSCTAFWQ